MFLIWVLRHACICSVWTLCQNQPSTLKLKCTEGFILKSLCLHFQPVQTAEEFSVCFTTFKKNTNGSIQKQRDVWNIRKNSTRTHKLIFMFADADSEIHNGVYGSFCYDTYSEIEKIFRCNYTTILKNWVWSLPKVITNGSWTQTPTVYECAFSGDYKRYHFQLTWKVKTKLRGFPL